MKIVELDLEKLQGATWNSNEMDEIMLHHLRTSLKKYDLLGNLVVRRVGQDCYEVLSGNQRLRVLKEMGISRFCSVWMDSLVRSCYNTFSNEYSLRGSK